MRAFVQRQHKTNKIEEYLLKVESWTFSTERQNATVFTDPIDILGIIGICSLANLDDAYYTYAVCYEDSTG